MLRWLVVGLVTLIVLAAAAVVLFASDDKPIPVPVRAGAFYHFGATVPHKKPGTLLRIQRVHGLPLGEKGWRVLYLTHGYDAKPAVVSGLVIVPSGKAPEARRHIVAFAHPVAGVAQRCGPSVLGGAAAHQIDGLRAFINAGDAVVVPDYQGLGTPGPHPLLLGGATARTVIDAVRAAGQLPGAHIGSTYAVFGESQGGQAALSVAQLSRRYGKRLKLVGVAAAAPPTKLTQLFAHSKGTVAGNVLAAFTLSSWVKIYDKKRLGKVITTQSAVRAIDDYCIADDSQPKSVVPHALALRITYLHKNPTRMKVWKRLLKRNSAPSFRTGTPMLITQGAADAIVSPGVTTDYVRSLCELLNTIDFVVYPGVNHDAIGAQSAPAVARWIDDRFHHKTPPSSCP